MKIISNDNELYVQARDLSYLISDKKISTNDKQEMSNVLMTAKSFDDYLLIKNDKLSNIIFSNQDILFFDELYNTPIKKLKKLFDDASSYINSLNDKYSDSYYESNEQIYDYDMRRKIEYIKYQIGEMIKYKLRKSKCNFPNIENPCTEIVFGDGLKANLSLDYDKVIISSINKQNIDVNDILSFGEIAYKIIMKDKIDEEENYDLDITYKLSEDNKKMYVEELMKEENILKKKKSIFNK